MNRFSQLIQLSKKMIGNIFSLSNRAPNRRALHKVFKTRLEAVKRDMEPKVYLAIYSGQKVYEMLVGDMAAPVMKRIEDSYLNATQILRAAGFPKPKRTKILEQEIHASSTHEKIQGGYGKYQGTWVPFDIGVALAKKYGIDEALQPLFKFDPAIDQLAARPLFIRKSSLGSNGKPSPIDSSPNEEDVPPTLTGGNGSDVIFDVKSETSARDAMKPPEPVRKSHVSPSSTVSGPEHAITKRTPIRSRAPSSTTVESPDNLEIRSSKHQEPTPKYPTEIATRSESFPFAFVPNLPSVSRRLFDDEPAQHHFFSSVYNRRQKLNLDDNEFCVDDVENYNFSPLSNSPKFTPSTLKQELLLHIYSKEDNGLNNAYFFEILRNEKDKTKFDVDLVLDDKESTPLHWAVACSRLNLAKLLIDRGATVMKVAKGGETSLMRALSSYTPFSRRSMDDILVLLGSSLFAVDEQKRTALHHTVLLSKYHSKRTLSNYYMECISNFIEDTKKTSKISFSSFLNNADIKGDTALHIACRYRNHRITFLLLSLGASKTMQNNEGETAISLAASDPRLKKLMQFLPEPEYDDYLDAPTTPMSDISEPEYIHESADTDTSLILNRSSSTLSSIVPLLDGQVSAVAAQLASSKLYISELKYQKNRFEEVLKYAGKVQATLDRPSTPLSIFPTPQEVVHDEAGANPNNKRQKLDRQATQKMLLQETKLSSRLIRLESLVKASREEQYELLKRIDLTKQERVLKDERYNRLIAVACNKEPEAMEGILAKVAEYL